jgi:hypothetical protein
MLVFEQLSAAIANGVPACCRAICPMLRLAVPLFLIVRRRDEVLGMTTVPKSSTPWAEIEGVPEPEPEPELELPPPPPQASTDNKKLMTKKKGRCRIEFLRKSIILCVLLF